MNKGIIKSLCCLILGICHYCPQYANATEQPQVHDLQKKPTEKVKDIDDSWVNTMHRTVSESVYQSAFWFDSFFTDDDTVQKKPMTNARIKLSWEPRRRDIGEFNTRFRIKLKLPHFKNKVDLILSDDSDDDLNQLPLDSANINPDTSNDHFAAAVRFIHKQQDDRLTDTRIGISGGDIFVRARHRRLFAWDDSHGFKMEPALYYFLDDGLGAKLLLEYNYQMSQQKQLRFNYSIRGSESFSGIRWKHGLYHLNQIADDKASVLGLQVEGERNGDRGFVIDKYTLSYRYRFNALKEWLFFEVEPFIEWPENENYKTTPGIALRVEGYFYKGQ
ncbi:hypothetical protein AAD001_16335 [Colwelliaceae bacterium 6471]